MGKPTNASQRGETVLVVPCYNEAERLDVEAFKSFAAEAPDVRFLFVNDGSSDNTGEMIEGLCRGNPARFAIHALDGNRGKAEAVRAGFLRVLEDSPSFVGFWDADLSTPLQALSAYLAVFDERPAIEMVFGSRVNLLGRSIRRKLSRHYIGRVFATAVAWALKLPIYDTQCGAKLFRATGELGDLFRDPFISKWIFDVEIIARAIVARHGTDRTPVSEIIYELPLTRWHDVDGSKIRPKDFVIVSLDLVRIYSRYLRRRR